MVTLRRYVKNIFFRVFDTKTVATYSVNAPLQINTQESDSVLRMGIRELPIF